MTYLCFVLHCERVCYLWFDDLCFSLPLSNWLNKQGSYLALAIPNKVQQQRPESLTVTLTWHTCKYKVHKLHQWYILTRGCTSGGVYLRMYLWWSLLEDVPLVEFTWGCTSGGVYLRMYIWWSLLEDVPLVGFTWGCTSGGVYLMYLWWSLLEDVPLVGFTWGCTSGGVYLRMYLWWGLLDRTRPRALVQNHHTRELISA